MSWTVENNIFAVNLSRCQSLLKEKKKRLKKELQWKDFVATSNNRWEQNLFTYHVNLFFFCIFYNVVFFFFIFIYFSLLLNNTSGQTSTRLFDKKSKFLKTSLMLERNPLGSFYFIFLSVFFLSLSFRLAFRLCQQMRPSMWCELTKGSSHNCPIPCVK